MTLLLTCLIASFWLGAINGGKIYYNQNTGGQKGYSEVSDGVWMDWVDLDRNGMLNEHENIHMLELLLPGDHCTYYCSGGEPLAAEVDKGSTISHITPSIDQIMSCMDETDITWIENGRYIGFTCHSHLSQQGWKVSDECSRDKGICWQAGMKYHDHNTPCAECPDVKVRYYCRKEHVDSTCPSGVAKQRLEKREKLETLREMLLDDETLENLIHN